MTAFISTAATRVLSRRAWPRAAASFFCSSTEASSSSMAAFPAKHVTRSNFDSAMDELRRLVRSSDFVAIDVEMTGVTSAPWRESFEFDRSDVRYLKVKDSAEKFAVVQFGVVPFRWDSKSLSFVAYPYNFYIFPRQDLSMVDNSSYEFLCQTASIDFLARYQFDFNACIRDGISYLSRRQEDEAKARLASVHKHDSCNLKEEIEDVPLVSMADILFSERIKKKFTEWRNWLLHSRTGDFQFEENPNDSGNQFDTRFFMKRPAINLNKFTSHQLRLIQLVTRKNFEDLFYVNVKGENGDSQQLIVYTDSKSDRELLMNEINDNRGKQAEMKIKSAIGFRRVIDLLSSEEKLIVGHNCMLDIAHIYNKFLGGPLPSTAEDFVSSINGCFPHILDTKILLNTHSALRLRMKKSKTSLSTAFSALCPHISLGFGRDSIPNTTRVSIDVEVDGTRSSTWNSGVKHEAGFDAFMTGCVFAQACVYTGIDFTITSQTKENIALHEKLQKHVNLLYLSWTNADIIDLRTGYKVAEPYETRKKYSRLFFDNVVLIWGFPSKFRSKEIKIRITEVFGLSSVTSVYHLDKTAVFIHFSNSDFVSQFLGFVEKLKKLRDPIAILNPITEILEGGKTRVASYETYKEICESPLSKVLFADQAEALGIKWEPPTDIVKYPPHDQSDDKNGELYAEDCSSADKILKSFYAEEERLKASSSNL